MLVHTYMIAMVTLYQHDYINRCFCLSWFSVYRLDDDVQEVKLVLLHVFQCLLNHLKDCSAHSVLTPWIDVAMMGGICTRNCWVACSKALCV